MEVMEDKLRQRDARIAALEAKTLADSVKGSWPAGTHYRRGELVQKGRDTSGLCMIDTEEQPGHSSSWRQWAGGR